MAQLTGGASGGQVVHLVTGDSGVIRLLEPREEAVELVSLQQGQHQGQPTQNR